MIKRVLGGLIFGSIMLYSTWTSIYKGSHSARLLLFGTEGQGKVAQEFSARNSGGSNRHKSQGHRDKGSTSHFLDYVITVDGQSYSGTCKVSQEEALAYSKESSLPVIYLSGRPEINSFGKRSDALWNAGSYAGIALLFGLLSLGGFLYAFKG